MYINSSEFISKSNQLISTSFLKIKNFNSLERNQLLSQLKKQYKIFKKIKSSDSVFTIILKSTGECLKNEIKKLAPIKKIGRDISKINECNPTNFISLHVEIDSKNVKYIKSELAGYLMNNTFSYIQDFLDRLNKANDPLQYKRAMPLMSVEDVVTLSKDKNNKPMFEEKGWSKYLLYHFDVTVHDEALGRKIQEALFSYPYQTHYNRFTNALQIVSKKMKNPKIQELALQEFGKAIYRGISLSSDPEQKEKVFNIVLKAIQAYAFLKTSMPPDLIAKIGAWLELQSDDKLDAIKALPHTPKELRLLLEQSVPQQKYPEMSDHHDVWKDRLQKILQSDLDELNSFQNEIGKRNLRTLLIEYFSEKTTFSTFHEVDFVELMQQVRSVRAKNLASKSSSSTAVVEVPVCTIPNYLMTPHVLGMGGQKVINLAININNFAFGAQAHSKGTSSISSEIRFMQQFDGPGFVHLMHVPEGKTNSEAPITYLMELCESDLKSLFPLLNDIQASKNPEDHAKLFNIVEQCLMGLVKLSHKQVFHRDIKEGNILIKREGGNIQAKIADFGLAIKLSDLRNNPSRAGTYAYRDPAFTLLCQLSQKVLKLKSEIEKNSKKEKKVNKSITKLQTKKKQIEDVVDSMLSEAKPDLWSFGVVLYHILHLDDSIEDLPFYSQEKMRSLFPKDMDEAEMSVEAFTYRLLQVNPKKRPTPQDALDQWREIRAKNPLFFKS